uniref:FAS-associated factor 1 n=1 Tax=Lygus hesperus TaxID=30085 RepID=A0A0A9YQG9_LYGHE
MAKNYPETLISPGSSEEDGCFEFIDNFERAYTPHGSVGPPFHFGVLDDAIKTAWARPATEVKLLVLYLHREGNPLTRRFTRIFLSGVVNKLLATHCVLWGWDLTLESNEKTLLRIVSNNLGYDNAWRLQMVGKMMYPCFVFLSRTHRKPGIEVVQFLKASADLNFAVTLFSNAVVTFSSKIKPHLVMKEEKNKVRSDSARIDTAKTRPNDVVEARTQGRPKSPTDADKRLPKGKPSLTGDPEGGSSLRDGEETLQTIADKMVGKAVDISGLFDTNSPQNPSNYPYHSQDEAAKKRLAELKKQYLEAEYERLKAEKKAYSQGCSKRLVQKPGRTLRKSEGQARRSPKIRGQRLGNSQEIETTREISDRSQVGTKGQIPVEKTGRYDHSQVPILQGGVREEIQDGRHVREIAPLLVVQRLQFQGIQNSGGVAEDGHFGRRFEDSP